MQKECIKTVYAVKPYTEPGRPVFKIYAYNAWEKLGGNIVRSLFPPRVLHGFAFRWQLPSIKTFYRVLGKGNNDKALLMFVQPISLNFDTFPYHSTHEIIPFIWDCWPCFFEYTCEWFKKNKVKTAIFTSSMTAELVKERFPQMNILAVTEGIDASVYKHGCDLKDRSIDFLVYGRSFDKVVNYKLPKTINTYRLGGLKGKKLIHTQQDLVDKLSDSKIVIALPQNWTSPEQAGNIETLTQRYWENMLARQLIVGHAPKELVDLIGYNPVIEINLNNPDKQIIDILKHIEDFQLLVDKNYATALKFGDWKYSMNIVRDWLISVGYKVSNNDY